MYPYIRDLFVHVLGFRPEDLLTDVASQFGNIPDLSVLAATDSLDAKGKPIKTRWLVLEAKDEPGIFLDPDTRRSVFIEKSKYIELDTAWFVMIDPLCIVLRPVSSRSTAYDHTQDTVLEWDAVTEEEFRQRLLEISALHSGRNRRLEAFRNGDETHIAEVKLSAPGKMLTSEQEQSLERARNEFYLALRTSASLLQNACRRALDAMHPETEAIFKLVDAFRTNYGIVAFQINPFRLTGKEIASYQANRQHFADVRTIAKAVRSNLTIAQLGCFTIPEFKQRVKEKDEEKRIAAAYDLLAAESASLMLSRCMMLRFFEDHSFFGNKKYLCNGGVKAFQEMRRHFGTSYVRLLRETYLEGSQMHGTVFGEDKLDWVLTSRNSQLSNAIERVLFYLSHFDFATVEQDVLSNIYGQFLETSQRKRLGEHYTPPDIARYIVRQLDLQPGDKVIDPACGLGTFLIEAYKVLAGDAALKGVATYGNVLEALANVRGNDINPFSAMVAQIQLLWHLFAFRDEIKKRGFPETTITGGYNSLHNPEVGHELFDAEINEFSLIDAPEYAAVIGNPPYVRPERQEAALSKHDQAYYNQEISAKIDLYSLFLYKALDAWCRQETEKSGAGKVGFVLPLSFCDNDDNKLLRRLFAIGGKWRIIEIVDFELIGPLVFGGDVVPIILIAERRPATPADKIRLRIADHRCAKFTGYDQKHIEFDITKATSTKMPYPEVFTPDGRILTRINPERKRILDKFTGQTFEDIAQAFWVGKRGGSIEKWELRKPDDNKDLRWETADLIRMGAAFRGRVNYIEQGGMDIYKGENIVACQLEGEPINRKIDVLAMDDPGPWKFSSILPKTGFAFHRIAPALTAAPFDPSERVMLNTATLFFPKSELQDFPFDFLVLSRLYQYFFAISQREAILFRARCNIYPSTVRRLPWSDLLINAKDKLNELRTSFLVGCQQLHQREQVLVDKLQAGNHTTLKDAILQSDMTGVTWSEDLLVGKSVKIGKPIVYEQDAGFIVHPSDDLLHWIQLDDPVIAQCFAEGLALQEDETLDRETMLAIPIPAQDRLEEWRKTVSSFDRQNYEQSLESILDKLDRIVAKAFKISPEEVTFIKEEFATDAMLRRVKPNLPFRERRLKGLRKGLESSDRFDKAYKTRH